MTDTTILNTCEKLVRMWHLLVAKVSGYNAMFCAGGGTFISKSGQPGTALDLAALSRVEGTTVDLPEDCIPSLNKLERHFEAITINHSKFVS